MKYIKKFNEHKDQSIFEIDWKTILPKTLVVIRGGVTDEDGYIKGTEILLRYKLGNVMANLVHQVVYDKDFDYDGIPDTLEFDISVIKNGAFQMNIEITFGDFIACGFEIKSPNVINVYQYTSYRSKMNTSDSLFAFNEESLNKLVEFFNRFEDIKISRKNLNFLDKDKNSYFPKK
jgi:hypothetical protein